MLTRAMLLATKFAQQEVKRRMSKPYERLMGGPLTRELNLVRSCLSAPTDHWAEFGVFEGGSARLLLHNLSPSGKLFLFDSELGLSRVWYSYNKGDWAAPIPDMEDPRVIPVRGMFEDTVAAWASEQEPGSVGFIHIDSDLYESAKTVLSEGMPAFHPHAVFVFDEFPYGEEKAWHEVTRALKLKFEQTYRSGCGQFQTFRLT